MITVSHIQLSNKELLLKAINIIKENYKDIFRTTEFRLTHNDFEALVFGGWVLFIINSSISNPH